MRPARFPGLVTRCLRHIGICLSLGIVSGCRLMGTGGPVSKEMAACRQLAQRGQSAVYQENWPAAEALFGQAVKTYPEDPAARRYYAEALWRRGAQREALRQAEEALRLAPDDPAIAVQLGEMNFDIGRSSEARSLANAALDVHPGVAAAWALRGRVAAREGQLESALSDLHRALQEAPGDRGILLEMAQIYGRLSRPQQAMATLVALEETYSAGDEPSRLLDTKGQTLSELARYADAVDAYSAAIAREPHSAELLARLADAQYRAGDPTSAVASANASLALDPAQPLALGVRQQFEMARLATLPGP